MHRIIGETGRSVQIIIRNLGFPAYTRPLYCVKHKCSLDVHDLAYIWFKGPIFTGCIWK